MTTSFPTGLDALTNPTGSSSLTSPDHAGQHTDANDAIEALQAKVGVNGSAVTTSLDYKIANGVLPKLNVDSGVLVVDATNNRVGVNTASPTQALEVVGTAYIQGGITATGDMYVDSTTFRVDASNNRVGVGTATPMYPLDVNGTVGATQFLQGTDYLSPYQGFRNKIINGSFEFWQRGTARTFMQAGQYLADRWTVRQYQQNAHQRTVVTPVAGMQTRYALRSSSSTTAEVSGGTRMWTNTALESGDSIPLRSKTVTLSFWVRFSSATCSSSTATPYGNWYGGIQWNTSTTDASMGANGADGASSLTLTNGSFPTTWTKYTVTGTIPSNANNVGIQFGFDGLGSTASANTVWYEITQVQLEVGSVATPFEQRPMQTELQLCQRYFQKSYSLNTAPASVTESGSYVFYGTSNVYVLLLGTVQLKVPMRVSPTTITFYNTSGATGTWSVFNTTGASLTPSPVAIYVGDMSFTLYSSIGSTSYLSGGMYGHWTASAEL